MPPMQNTLPCLEMTMPDDPMYAVRDDRNALDYCVLYDIDGDGVVSQNDEPADERCSPPGELAATSE